MAVVSLLVEGVCTVDEVRSTLVEGVSCLVAHLSALLEDDSPHGPHASPATPNVPALFPQLMTVVKHDSPLVGPV